MWGLLALACAPLPVDEHIVAASAYEEDYRILVSRPESVEPTHVVLLLDGNDWIDTTHRIARRLEDEGHGLLVVGVGYTDQNERGRDYTPPAPGMPDGHGEVDAFWSFLQDDLMPFVDAEYGTFPVDRRTVLGHSFGGIGALYGLFHAPNTVGNVVALSPSLTYGDGWFFTEEAATDHPLVGNVYLGAGSLEAYGLAGLTEEFGAVLDARPDPDLSVTTELHRGRIHNDVFPVAAEAGLRAVLEAE